MNIIKDTMIASILVLSIIIILIVITGDDRNEPITEEFYSLGTIIQLKLYGRKSKKAINEAIQKITDIDNKMSVFKDYSEVSKINEYAGKEPKIVSKDTYLLIKKALEYCSFLQGKFDVTIRPLVKLWGIGYDNPRIPKRSEIENKLKLVNYNDIVLDEETCSVFLKNEKQEIDLGGIAKGYAADEVRRILLKNNIKNGIIDLGGNIFAHGTKNDGSPWRVGIQNPFSSRGKFIGFIEVNNKSIVTSGDYERYFIENGKKIHHIIDPTTGYPSDNNIASATIISEHSMDGDGLSTGIYVMGIKKAIKLIHSIKGVEAIFITKNKKIYATEGVREKFILTNDEFKIDNVFREELQNEK